MQKRPIRSKKGLPFRSLAHLPEEIFRMRPADVRHPPAAHGHLFLLLQLDHAVLDPAHILQIHDHPLGAGHKALIRAQELLHGRLAGADLLLARPLQVDNDLVVEILRVEDIVQQAGDHHFRFVEAFRKAVVEYIVPIADSIYRAQAKRLGKEYPMSFADNALEFRSGNPKPAGTADDILQHGLKFYSELSPETKEFFSTMMADELLDVLSTEGKEGGGYCTGLPKYNVPFIFANFNGTQGDVSVVTHEAGHAFAYWMNADRVPTSQSWPGMEACEVHSMSMEFFAWPWAEGFFKEDTRKFYYSHLAEALTFIPYGTMVDHFQHVVYEHPEYTPAERHAVWKKLLGIYQPWMKLDGDIPFYAEGQGWQRQHHIYSYPLYYIDYCLAQTVSLEYWAMMQEDQKNAWDHYMAYTCQGGTEVFTKLLENAGMESPFEAATLKKVAETAKTWLDNFDMTGIC